MNTGGTPAVIGNCSVYGAGGLPAPGFLLNVKTDDVTGGGGGKRGYIWLSTERCCDIDPCGDLFDNAYGRAAGLNTSYFETLKPWAASITGLFINCGHTLDTDGKLLLPNKTQTQRLAAAVTGFGKLNITVLPMILTHYDTAGQSLSALASSSQAQQAFIKALVADTTAHTYGGYNIDWEPCTGKTAARECGARTPAAKWPQMPGIVLRLRAALAASPRAAGDPNWPVVSAAGYACDVPRATRTAPTEM